MLLEHKKYVSSYEGNPTIALGPASQLVFWCPTKLHRILHMMTCLPGINSMRRIGATPYAQSFDQYDSFHKNFSFAEIFRGYLGI